MSILEKIFSVKNMDCHKVWTVCGIKMKFLNTSAKINKFETQLNEFISQNQLQMLDIDAKISHINNIILERLNNSDLKHFQIKLETYRAIPQLHTKIFKPYKNIYTEKNIYIIATGPTLKYFKQIEDGVYIGVNKSFLTDIKLKYLFMQDYIATQGYIEMANDYPCVKFYGKFVNPNLENHIGIPQKIREKANAKSYYNNFPSKEIFYDIENNALMDFTSVTFAAIHFALYTGSKKIHLVGCDCSNNGYYDNTNQNSKMDVEYTMQGYNKLKEFCSLYYPDVEIISVNPIGLKGLFKDIYTEEFLHEHPDIARDSVEILSV